MRSNCYHCGTVCQDFPNILDEKVFCNNACENAYTIIKNHGLSLYYDLETFPGTAPKKTSTLNTFLDEKSLPHLLELKDVKHPLITLFVPNIKSSSCIWLLENLHMIFNAIVKSKVNFHTKNVRITYNSKTLSVKEVILLLRKLGYQPSITLGHPN